MEEGTADDFRTVVLLEVIDVVKLRETMIWEENIVIDDELHQ